MGVEFWTGLLSIVIIDLVLAGDNAIVIGLAARNIPKKDQFKVMLWGMLGAAIIRIIATLGVVYLLKIPGLLVIGGLLLVWIAIKLVGEEHEEQQVKAGNSMRAAIRTIIIADATMGLDNVLAVAGTANGRILLVIVGLMISIPIIMLGSTLVLRLIEHAPWIIVLGSAVLGWSASKMFVSEPRLTEWFADPVVKYSFEALVVAFVVIGGLIMRNKNKTRVAATASSHKPN